MSSSYKVVCSTFAATYKKIPQGIARPSDKNNTILMGSFVKLLDEATDTWQKVTAFGIEGWIEKIHLGDSPGLKCFYIDVGQGDGALIEVGNDQNGIKMLIDGGPSDNISRYLSKWHYKYQFNKNLKVHFDYVFISHFDKDHYNGLIDIINDEHYTFGTIFHNGIAKFDKEKITYPKDRYNTVLGKKERIGGVTYLTTLFETIEQLTALKENGGMQDLMEKFLSAVKTAQLQGRIQQFKRIDYTGIVETKTINGLDFKIDILGPVTSSIGGKTAYKYFDDDAHTVNGHSIVLKITYGERSLLFGGDLNIPAEEHLLEHYQGQRPFDVDVAKSCHHGASEFTVQFMAQVNPYATVISSGDNESYSHPRADAIGCAGKYSKSERPLVFSTELARSSNVKTDEVKYGMINLRSDGKKILMAQMKEAAKSGSVWDIYHI